MILKTRRPGRLMFFVAVLVALPAACILGATLLRDAVASAEARSAIARAQASSSAATPGAAGVRIEVVGTERDGITGRPRIADIEPQQVGQAATRFIGAGPKGDTNVCRLDFPDKESDEFLVLWKLDVKVVSIAAGRTTLQVHWTRARRDAAIAERDDHRTITLGAGDSHIIDYVENQADTGACASVLVRISAEPILQTTQRVAVDLWTVDEGGAGEPRSVYKRVEGLSGQSLDYHLSPMEILPATTAGGHALHMDVSGKVVASISPDGSVDVDLRTVRRALAGKNSTTGEGHVQFRARVGETAAVLLPDPTGRLPLPSGNGAAVDLGRAFAGHRLSVYVKVSLVQ
jgi:hypothetical protein